MMVRFEVHPKLHGDSEPEEWFWHCRSANGETTVTAEGFTRHRDAVRAIRGHLVGVADLLGMTPDRWAVASGLLTYFDVTGYDAQGLPIYEEKPLYPARELPEVATSADDDQAGADHG